MSKQEIDITNTLQDETEVLLQYGTLTWDVRGNVFKYSAGQYALLGYSKQEAPEIRDLDFFLQHVLEEHQSTLKQRILESVAEKADFEYVYAIRDRAGAVKTLSTRGKVIENDAGQVELLVCINRNITDLQRFQDEQERFARELSRSAKELEEFAYIASHDLQEPLRKISMFTERLKAKYDNTLDKEGEMFVGRIMNSVVNMRTLIDNLLDYSRANRRSSPYEQVDMAKVLDKVRAEFTPNIEEKGADFCMTGSFPIVEASFSEMVQLFGNLLSNALKFTKSGQSIQIEVRSSTLTKDEQYQLGLPPQYKFHRIEMHDNGIGFEMEYAEKIFKIFQRLNGKAEFPGSGIGLAICKKIIEKHNGLIFAEGRPDEGSVFTVVLPEKQY